MNPYEQISKHVLIENKFVIDLIRSQGSWIVESSTGKSYLDCFSQFASQALGWNHPKMIGNRNRIADVAIHKLANSDVQSEPYAKFVEEFIKFVPNHQHLFFIDGGALAVENALKVAFDWKMRKLGWKNDHFASYLNVIHLQEAFHGRTGYTLSITNNKDQNNPKTWGFPKFNWTRIVNPKCLHGINGQIDHEKAKILEDISIQDIEYALEVKTHPVAALIIEPIQGEGGDNHFRKEYLLKLRNLANQHDFMLIFDEVQTGVGLTGKFWAFEHFDIEPDIICFGKKTQVCGIACNKRVDEVENNCFTTFSRINSTWGGNLVDMIRSTMQLQIIQEDYLIDNAAEVGKYFQDQLRSLYSISKRRVSNVRGRGLMCALDLNSTKERNEVLNRLIKNMLVLPCGDKAIRFRPHLTFSKADVDVAMDYIRKAL